MERNVVIDDNLLVIEMIGDDADNIDRQRPDAPAIEQVIEAMAEARHHQKNLHPLCLIVQRHLHAEFFRDGRQPVHQRVACLTLLGNETHAYEKTACAEIVELRTVDDVAPLLSEKA